MIRSIIRSVTKTTILDKQLDLIIYIVIRIQAINSIQFSLHFESFLILILGKRTFQRRILFINMNKRALRFKVSFLTTELAGVIDITKIVLA